MLAMSTLNKSIFKTYSNSITLANNHHQELVLQKSASNASTVVKSAALDGAEEVRLDLHKDGEGEGGQMAQKWHVQSVRSSTR
jgi:hypothetical protein